MTATPAKLQHIPATIASVSDYEPYARERVSEQVWAFLAGGAADEVTVGENTAAFRRIPLAARVLRDLTDGSTAVDLFGRTHAVPILLAPVAYQRLAHPEGELATALAAAAMGAGMVVSTEASVPLEDIAARTEAPLWFQLYIQPDRGFTRALVQRVEAAGYQALMVTVDAPLGGPRNREQRAGFVRPANIQPVNLAGMLPPPSTEGRPGAPVVLGTPLLAAAPTWADLVWLRSSTRLPVLVKGVMTADDARRALEEGVDGIVVSNHGGRILDSQPATIDVLARIAAEVDGRVPVLMDGGIRRGTDVLKALALGAAAVLIGRPYMFGLAAAGAVGVAHVLHILRAELEVAMALTGCKSLAAVGPTLVGR